MRKYLALLACTAAFAGCSTTPETVTQAELEKQVEGMYTADDPDAEITADCAGELDAEIDAMQDCHLQVGEETADVHVVVTKVIDGDVEFEATPYIPAERVAETIKNSLADQGYEVDSVECDDELVGEMDETTTCTASPADGEGEIEVTVSEVDGLMVNFNYEVVS